MGGQEKKEEKEEEDNLLVEFLSNTTAHGFAQIILNPKLPLKILWVLVIIGFNVMLYFQINSLVQEYFRKPVKTVITLKNQQSQRFPMITICNTNNIKYSKMTQLKNTKYFKDKDYLFTSSSAGKNKAAEAKKSGAANFDVNEEDQANFEKQEEMLSIMASFAENDGPQIFDYGHQFNETFRACTWLGYYDCSIEEFWQPIWHWRYGNCFAYNTHGNGSASKVTDTGQLGGLNLKLYLNQHEYFEEYMTDTAGIVVHIGEPLSRIEPYHNGFSLGPNLAHYIDLKMTKVHRVDPFKNESCIKDSSFDLGKRSFGQRIVKKYSIRLCKDICLAKEQIKRCGCSAYSLPSLNGNRTCMLSNDTDYFCVDDIMYEYEQGELPCVNNCRPPCEETQYNVISSSRSYPSLRTAKSTPGDHNNVLKVSISYSTMETYTVSDKEYYFIENLLGDIGGQLGLWSGFSLMTVIEVVVLLFHAFFFTCGVVFCRKKKMKAAKSSNMDQEKGGDDLKNNVVEVTAEEKLTDNDSSLDKKFIRNDHNFESIKSKRKNSNSIETEKQPESRKTNAAVIKHNRDHEDSVKEKDHFMNFFQLH